MSNIPHQDLLADILAFCEARGMSRPEFGRLALSDPRFVYDLEKGRECRSATLARVRGFMASARGLARQTAAPAERAAE